jgi:hypothetical protein
MTDPYRCPICNRKPIVEAPISSDRKHIIWCSGEGNTHTHNLNTFGRTKREAIQRWNKLYLEPEYTVAYMVGYQDGKEAGK